MPDQVFQLTTSNFPSTPLVPAAPLVGHDTPSGLEAPFPRKLQISVFVGEKDNLPARSEATWPQLVESLRTPRVGECTLANCLRSTTKEGCPSKSGALWSPAFWPAGHKRKSIGVEGVSALVVDIDHVKTDGDLLGILERLAPYRHLVAASHSDQPGDRCVRVLIAISRTVTGHEWKRFWGAAMLELGLPADPQTCDASRVYFLPARPIDACGPEIDGTGYVFQPNDGAEVNVDQILANAPADPTPAPRTLTSVPTAVVVVPEDAKLEGAAQTLADVWPTEKRHTAQLALAGALARAGWPVDVIAQFCARVAELQQPGNGDIQKRLTAARTSVDKVTAGEAVQGWPSLIEVVGEDAVAACRALLGMTLVRDDAFVAVFKKVPVANAVVDAMAKAKVIAIDAAESSPVGRAQTFVREHATNPDGIVNLRRWQKDWLRWIDGRYASTSAETIRRDLYQGLQLDNGAAVRHVEDALIAVPDVLIDGAVLGTWIGTPTIEGDPLDLAACPNGLVNLRTGQVAPATPSYFATSVLGVPYDVNAPEPTGWLAFLEQIWPDDGEPIAALQEWMGLQLTPDTRQQKILLLLGLRRSGKGTILRVIRGMLGAGSVAAPTLASLSTNFGRQPLIGKIAALIADARLSARTDVAQVLECLLSISGQDFQTIDRKHLGAWEGYLSTRITICTNELPKMKDPSGALAGRLIALHLKQSFYGKEDTALTDKLLLELPGILRWSIDGWRRLRERGHLVQPSASAGLIRVIEDLGSTVTAWVRDLCEVGPPFKVLKTEAYASYRGWCLMNNHPAVAGQQFGVDLLAAGYYSSRPRVDGRHVPHYVGLQLAVLPVAGGS